MREPLMPSAPSTPDDTVRITPARPSLRILLKELERRGRRWLVRIAARALSVRPRPVVLPTRPRILVVRLDERVGNLLLTLPLLESLKLRYPLAEIELLASPKAAALVRQHRCLSACLMFRKRALFAADGPLRTLLLLRRRRYHLAIDSSNPTDPSTTQALLVRFSGAQHSIGAAHGAFARLFSAPAVIPEPTRHEIELRLALLGPVPGRGTTAAMALPALPPLPTGSPVPGLQAGLGTYVVLNVGARLADKRADAPAYAAMARIAIEQRQKVVVSYGPAERPLAEAVVQAVAGATLAPPTSLAELGVLMQRAAAVISCDTGPMHLAVALGRPTCGVFISTDPARYGHADPPHLVLDARGGFGPTHVAALTRWLGRSEQRVFLPEPTDVTAKPH